MSVELFYKDDAVLPVIKSLYEPGGTRQEKTDKVVAAVLEYLQNKEFLVAEQFRMMEHYKLGLTRARHEDWERMRDMATRTQGGGLYCEICSEARTTQIGFTRVTKTNR